MSTQTIANPSTQDRWAARLSACTAVLDFDFCPWANRWVYWLKNPLWCLVLALSVSIVCGVLVNSQLWLVTGALALVLATGVGWPWLAIRGVTCELAFDQPRTRVNEPVMIRLRVTNRWPWPVWGIALERGFGKHGGRPGGAAFARLPGWWRGEFEWPFEPVQRGVFPLERPALVTGFPFGVWTASRSVGVANRLIVWPRTVPLTGMPDGSEIRPSEQRLTDRRAGDFGERLGTRRFHQGDSLRRVHWVQSARHGQLIVNELQAPAISTVRVEIDVDSPVHRAAGGQAAGTLEPAIEVGASICESLYRQHAVVECSLADRRFTVTDQTGLRALLDALAHVPVSGVDPTTVRGSPCDASAWNPLQLVVTTELGRARRSGDGSTSPRQRVLVVSSAGRCTPLDEDRGLIPPRDPQPGTDLDALNVLRDEWRRICRG